MMDSVKKEEVCSKWGQNEKRKEEKRTADSGGRQQRLVIDIRDLALPPDPACLQQH